MKNRKRNLTMLAVMMFVWAAVGLNWTYNNRWGTPDTELVYAEDEMMLAAEASFEESLMTAGTEYFAEARLTRQLSRDEALSLLETAASSDGASQETIDSVMNAISAMATCSMQESQIENLLIAKDFEDCVVYIGNESVTVAVPAPIDGLSEEEVAQITDIICKETQYKAAPLGIIEVKA